MASRYFTAPENSFIHFWMICIIGYNILVWGRRDVLYSFLIEKPEAWNSLKAGACLMSFLFSLIFHFSLVVRSLPKYSSLVNYLQFHVCISILSAPNSFHSSRISNSQPYFCGFETLCSAHLLFMVCVCVRWVGFSSTLFPFLNDGTFKLSLIEIAFENSTEHRLGGGKRRTAFSRKSHIMKTHRQKINRNTLT